MSDWLYLSAPESASSITPDAVLRKLQRVCVLLDAIIQSDRSRYLEARTWLLNSIASQCPPADVRLACWEPLLAEALAAPPPPSSRRGPSPSRHPDDGEGGRRSPGGRAQNTDGVGGSAVGGGAAAGAVGSVPGPAELLTQLLMLVSEVWPDKVTALLLERPQVFVDFFQGPGSSRRILMWFSHFSMDGMRAFKYGSYALAHYALAHREQVWDLLRWEGKHPQAPVAVASKTHYFCELALVPSVRQLLRHAPAFWASEAWRECCRDGAVLELDRRHFCEVLLDDLRRVGGRDRRDRDPRDAARGGRDPGRGSVGARLAALLRDFLSAPAPPAPLAAGHPAQPHPHWQLLCQRLLHQLDERQLLRLINTLAARQRLQMPPPPPEAAAAAAPAAALVRGYAAVCGEGGWQDLGGLVLCGGAEWGSVAEVVLAHALAAGRGPLQRLLAEEREELAGRLEEVEGLAWELHGAPGWGGGGGGSGEGGGGGGGGGEEGGRGGGRAEDCSAAAHAALLYGGWLQVAGPGRRCAQDRLQLLAEVWTLREALRRAAEQGPPPAGGAVHAPDGVAGWPRGPAGGTGGGGGGGDASLRLPLERVMTAVGGVAFERLLGRGGKEAEGGGDDGGRRGRRTPPFGGSPSAATPSHVRAAAAAAGPSGCVGRSALAAAGQYELLPSDDEEQGHGSSGRRRRRRSRDRSRGRSRGSSRRSKKAEDRNGSRHGRKHKRKKRRRWRSRSRSGSESPHRSQSRSRERVRAGEGTSGSSSSSSREDEGGRTVKGRRTESKQRKRRRGAGTPTSSSSSSSAEENSSSEMATSGSDGEGARARRRRERCGSSGLEGHDTGRRDPSRRRRRPRSGVPDSGRSSTFACASSGRELYGRRRTDSDELEGLDPLALLRGARCAAAWGGDGGDRDGRGTVWRVRLPGGGGDSGGRGLARDGEAAVSATVTAAAVADVEVVGGYDDVADLLAVAACKHWLAAMLQRNGGGGRRGPSGSRA